MIITTDLRLAIKAAEKTQPSSDCAKRDLIERHAIQQFLKSHPGARRIISRCRAVIVAVDIVKEKARTELVKRYGLRLRDPSKSEDVEFSYGDNSRNQFGKAGGKLPPDPIRRWKADEIMTELAAAPSMSAAQKTLRRIGIDWR